MWWRWMNASYWECMTAGVMNVCRRSGVRACGGIMLMRYR